MWCPLSLSFTPTLLYPSLYHSSGKTAKYILQNSSRAGIQWDAGYERLGERRRRMVSACICNSGSISSSSSQAITVVIAIFKVLERTQKQEQQVCTRSWGATQAAMSQQKQPQWRSVHGLWVKSFSLLSPSSRCGSSLVQLPIFG